MVPEEKKTVGRIDVNKVQKLMVSAINTNRGVDQESLDDSRYAGESHDTRDTGL